VIAVQGFGLVNPAGEQQRLSEAVFVKLDRRGNHAAVLAQPLTAFPHCLRAKRWGTRPSSTGGGPAILATEDPPLPGRRAARHRSALPPAGPWQYRMAILPQSKTIAMRPSHRHFFQNNCHVSITFLVVAKTRNSARA